MNHGGQGATFYKKMMKEEGQNYMDMLEELKLKDKRETLKSFAYYTKLLEEYKKISL